MWRKSSKSNTGANCVEVRNDLAAIRDSKNPGGAHLTMPSENLSLLLTVLRSGKLDP